VNKSQEDEWKETMHGLIGILIRTEDEMGIPNNLDLSIRNLGLESSKPSSTEN